MSDRLERMRANPKADWKITDVEAVCREYGIECTAPALGELPHKVKHPGIREVLTVLFKWPVRPVYIRRLAEMIDEVRGLP